MRRIPAVETKLQKKLDDALKQQNEFNGKFNLEPLVQLVEHTVRQEKHTTVKFAHSVLCGSV